MGTWDSGPFDNDAAADVLAETQGSASSLESILKRCADAPSEQYLEVDEGQSAIAIGELVALGFGYGNLESSPANVREIARKLGPNERLRMLAIRALLRVRGPNSEIASLWAHEPAFDAQLARLVDRLTEAGE
jgi:hypothetical protein